MDSLEQQKVDQQEPLNPSAPIILDRHPKAATTGGFNLSQGESTDMQATVAQIFKSFGAKIVTGNFSGLCEFSKPISISKEKSFLEIIANEQQYCSTFIKNAVDQGPYEQIQSVLAYFIAGMHSNAPYLMSKAPLDSLVGETLSMVKDDGTQIYLEQIRGNPTQTLFQIYCPAQSYTITGSHQIQLKIHKTLNSISVLQIGKYKIKFNNGFEYECIPPEMIMSGLMMGDMTMNFNGKIVVTCPQSNLKIEAVLNYNSDGVFKKFTSFFSAQPPAETKIYDLFTVQLSNQDGSLMMKGNGSWLGGLIMDNKVLWRISDHISPWQQLELSLMPSDSYLRPDLMYMLQGKMQEAQAAKTSLEEIEKKDSELRKKGQLKTC